MELFSDEVTKIKGLLEDWQTHPEIEVEATFGQKGLVDMQTFLRVVNRLRSKGYEAMSQQDRLTVSLPDQVRFTLSGAGQVAQYCRDNRMMGKPFVAIIKDRNVTESQEKSANIDLEDYDVRVKGRREIELSKEDPRVVEILGAWDRKRKFFRMIRRWTFKIPGLKFDLSMVRSTQRDRTGQAWQRVFQDQSLISAMPTFEIEVELDRGSLGEKDPFKTLIAGMGEVLRGIQGCPLLTRKSTKESVLKAYKDLTGLDRFRGVKPITLEKKNMLSDRTEAPDAANIRDDYNVTDKADGLRVHGFTDEKGELFMIDMAMNVLRTGLRKEGCANVLLDGEQVTQDKTGKVIQEFLIFDIYYFDGKDVTKKPFRGGRQDNMTLWIQEWQKGGGPTRLLKSASLFVTLKRFFFASGEHKDTDIFLQAHNVLKQNAQRIQTTDGLIFTPNTLPLPSKPGVGFPEQFKWKPAEDNTVDFLVSTVKDEINSSEDKISIEIHPVTGETIRQKTFHLFVGSSSSEDPAQKDPRATILQELPLPGSRVGAEVKQRQKPVPFIPMDFPDAKASLCYLVTQIDPKSQEEFVVTERAQEPIRDRSIVEMRQDSAQPPGWRWIPIRVRADKTEKFLKNRLSGTLNSEETALSVWNSIHDPITEFMITTGSDIPSAEEKAAMHAEERPVFKRYQERKAPLEDQRKVKALQEFHNRQIKDEILQAAIGKNTPEPMILDVAVGRGNDLHRWRRIGASFILGVDATGECCRNNETGAQRRLLDTIVSSKKHPKPMPIPPMFFVVGDSSLRLVDGTAGDNDEEKNMLRSILGRVEATGPVPPLVQKYAGSLALGSTAMTCMYALHQFFESPDKLNGLLQNIADNLQVGGLFVGTCFDGEATFNLLRGTEKGKSRVGMDGETILWDIKKLQDADDLPIDDSAFGMAIDVNFISIGLTHTEYLVPWPLLVAKMKTIGCELLESEDLTRLGLQRSTNMYEVSYGMAMKDVNDKKKTNQKMIPAAKEQSFLNRWFIFKRVSQGAGEIGKVQMGLSVLGDMPVQEVVATAPAPGETIPSAPVEPTPFIAGPGLASLAPLSAAATASGTFTEMMSGVAPSMNRATAAAAVLQQQITAAKVTGDIETLKQLNAQAKTIRAAIRKPAAAVGPAGTTAQAFVDEFQNPAAVTVPVAPSTAQLLEQPSYKPSEVFQFSETSVKDVRQLELPERYKSYAGRHLAPNAPFRVRNTLDASDTSEQPSIVHFLAAMKFKQASKHPELARVFARDGEIHQRWLASRLAAKKGQQDKPLTVDQQNEFVLKETQDVETEEIKQINTVSVGFNSSLWATKKDSFLESAIRQRLTADKWFCEIVSAAIAQNKQLLQVDKTKGSELGGTRTIKGTIQGQNKYGRLILTLASTMPEQLKACLALPDTV